MDASFAPDVDDQIFAFEHVVEKNVEGVDITSLEIRDTIHSTHVKYYVDPNDDGNHQEIFKPDPNAPGYVLPFRPGDLATLLSKGEIYTQSGHKFFPPEGNVYNFSEGSATLLVFLMEITQLKR